MLNRLGFIPRGGESFEADGFRFTVMEMDHRRVSRVKMKPLRPAETAADVVTDIVTERPADAKSAADAGKLRSAKAPR